jgi:tRNA-binding protein
MILYYNREGIGDTLILYLKESGKQTFQSKGEVTRIYDIGTDETLGFNFSNASEFLDVHTAGQVKPDEQLIDALNKKLVDCGLDPELPHDLQPLIVSGQVLDLEEHPDSDHMHVCRVDCGNEILQIVCGAPNIDKDQKVVVAKLGALMPNGTIIRPTVLRGVSSDGMICSARELDLPNAPQKRGILVLDPGTETGQDFYTLVVQKMHASH